jgi:hypothetical protein
MDDDGSPRTALHFYELVFFRLFLHDGNRRSLSILPVPLFGALSIASRADGLGGGASSFFLYIPKIQAYFTFDGTLVFNDCMERVNIPRWDGVYNVGAGTVKRFLFLLTRTHVPIVAIKRGWLVQRSTKIFYHSRD